MCGIAGIINYRSSENKKTLLLKMSEFQRHRGPDAFGTYIHGPAGLAHTRLSIIDLNSGDQPIHNENKSIWIIFNGEIFNYPELRKQLQSKGHKFYTKSDTEVIIHLYEEFGTSLFEHLNGQFAFAIWDLNKEELLLGRDSMGISPLFYHHNHHRLVFASEIKALFADNTIPRQIDPQNLSDIFTCWSTFGDQTCFKDIFQIPPGHYARFSTKGLEIKQYWELPFGKRSYQERPVSDWAGDLNQILLDATRIRLRADVPVGAYLSGGIDSTYTSSLVKNNFNNKLCTFSVGFSDKQFDESHFQKTAVDYLGTDHKTISCSYNDIGKIFPRVIWHTETPIIRTAPAPLMLLSQLVRESNFKVVLTGEGADEIFAGYNIFKEDKVRRFWAKNPNSKIRPRLLEKLYPYIFSQNNSRAVKFLELFFKKGMMDLDSPVYSHMLRWDNTSHLKQFFSKDLKNQTSDLDDFTNRYIKTLPDDFMSWDSLSRAQFIENKVFMSNYLLSSQGDRMAMANSIEGRYPFLDHRVIEFAAKLPPHIRMNGMTEKYILKKAAKGKIPSELINRPKQPYRAPISQAFLGETYHEYVHELLSEKTIREYGYFDPQKTTRLLQKCQQQKGTLLSERENMALVGILSTQLLDFHFIKNLSN
ncbi:MAG: asparagine synthase (glutamine-hydrolyzing) [Desulfobacula sp.]|uniref:asparagine synthase (glutamine-hydrolyzing) n=1 Tax=Desulfobacula sp. TaxID=2593537 RepID=UPI0025BF2F9A|nr:asparagine synthase (glutamine-hydrolyzing) [Desulfobacula sp.]MCD4722486.1 asparagine synthase (glutamine-hydrolyzing) [Desulfobacula sp.]